MGPQRVGAPKGGGSERWRPNLEKVGSEGWEPKISRFFSFSRHNFHSSLPLLGVLSWNFGGVRSAGVLKCAHLEFSGCCVKPRSRSRPAGRSRIGRSRTSSLRQGHFVIWAFIQLFGDVANTSSSFFLNDGSHTRALQIQRFDKQLSVSEDLVRTHSFLQSSSAHIDSVLLLASSRPAARMAQTFSRAMTGRHVFNFTQRGVIYPGLKNRPRAPPWSPVSQTQQHSIALTRLEPNCIQRAHPLSFPRSCHVTRAVRQTRSGPFASGGRSTYNSRNTSLHICASFTSMNLSFIRQSFPDALLVMAFEIRNFDRLKRLLDFL